MRLAHISDLHFGSFSINPLQFFSKRWIGNFNFLFNRKKNFDYNRLIELIDLLKEQEVTHVVITGDFTVTARKIEFRMGQKFVQLLEKEGMQVFTIPGNHDHYTQRSFRKKHFYRYFSPTFEAECPLNLRDHCVTFSKISEGLWLLGMDTAIPVPLLSAEGLFGPIVEKSLKNALSQIPVHETVIVFNHYPFFTTTQNRHSLSRGNSLEKILKNAPNVQLYLHGHTHRRIIADLRASDLPIISDTGSTPHVKDGACHLFEIDDNAIKLIAYEYDDGWMEHETHKFNR